MTTTQYDETTPRDRGGSWVRWGPAFAGAISSIALTATIMTFWLAVGYGSSVTWFVDNMQWFFLGTALFSLSIGGMVAGYVAGKRGMTVGLVDGMMVWGLVLVAALIPLSLRALALTNGGAANPGTHATSTALGVSGGNMWALFGALVGGLFCTLAGGAIAGAGRRVRAGHRGQYDQRQFEPGAPPLRERAGERRVG
jgi:hypothetical protein